ncbi:hypothetical protein ACFCV3_19380 [Kribbella sp. NPDC056345]|uniref:hypothetical protein n=1 Tax=Kribbella sp. NPDC056345 TaxID=3345789 RepID=UPI0035E1E659
MTHDLNEKFAVLTDDRPEPIDPAALVRTGITRRRRRRATTGILATAAVTAVAFTAAPLAGALLRTDPPTAGVPQATPPVHRLPDPWVNKPVPGAKGLYHFAQGKTGNHNWIVGARGNCVVFQNADLWRGIKSTNSPMMTAGEGPACTPDGYPRLRGGLGYENDNIGILAGTITAAARKVRVTNFKQTYVVDAVGTPASSTKRFFAIAFEGGTDPGWTAVPLDAGGRPIR